MKKVLILILCLLMVVCVFTACNGDDQTQSPTDPPTSEQPAGGEDEPETDKGLTPVSPIKNGGNFEKK